MTIIKLRVTTKACLTLLCLWATNSSGYAQNMPKDSVVINGSFDILSNFIWRGVPLDHAPCIQPALSVGYKRLELAMLGSYSLGGTFNATPFYLKYNIKTGTGTFTPMLFDYYYPFKHIAFDNLSDHQGAHTLEASLAYKANKLPLRLFFSMNVHNESQHSKYGEIAYSFNVNKTYVLELFTGGTFTKNSSWLGATDAGLTNVGINVKKNLTVKDYMIPIALSYSLHTQLHCAYLTAKMHFSL